MILENTATAKRIIPYFLGKKNVWQYRSFPKNIECKISIKIRVIKSGEQEGNFKTCKYYSSVVDITKKVYMRMHVGMYVCMYVQIYIRSAGAIFITGGVLVV